MSTVELPPPGPPPEALPPGSLPTGTAPPGSLPPGPPPVLPDPVPTAPAPGGDVGRAGALRLGWPLWACTAGIPLAFAVGLHGLVWVLPGVVLGWRLLWSRDVRLPRSTLFLAAFLVVAALGVAQVPGAGRVVFAYRWLVLAGVLCAEVWLCSVPLERLPTERVVRWLGLLWVWVVAFGWAAMAARVDRLSPLQQVLPPGLRGAGFVDQLTSWRLSEVQQVADAQLARPSAPFAWANGWGSAYALTAPCFVRSWLVGVTPRRRAAGVVLAAAGIPPLLASLNRGVWLTLGAVLVVAAVRTAWRRDLRPLAALAVAAATVAVLLSVTPLGASVTARLSDATDSNEARAEIYRRAWSGTFESPLVGHGAPAEVEGSSLPPVGTHGLLWNLLWSTGLVGTALFLLWLFAEVVRSAPARAPGSLWLHLTLLVGVLQLPVYGLLPQVLLLGVVAGLVRREGTAGPLRRNDREVGG